jgi:phenylalanyl-tRNA synthetase beta chain
MKGSYRWLRELTGVDVSPVEMAEALTRLGLEVEELQPCGHGLEHVVVAEVRGAERVPDKDKLRLVSVFDGEKERQVICGAPNVPGAGGQVLLALPGARLPNGMEIAERRVGGVVSSGMLCSETELAIGADPSGILVLGDIDEGRPGQAATDALALEDVIFEIGLTPNRPDCLGHLGLAREVAAAAFSVPFAPPPADVPANVLKAPTESGPSSLNLLTGGGSASIDTLTLVDADPRFPTTVPVTIADPERCPRYAAAVLHRVKVRRSPFWLRYRLPTASASGASTPSWTSPTWSLFEHGHPIHAFDLRKIRGDRIEVRLAREGERMVTLDEVERVLTDDDLLICDGEGPIALAGVMGGANSEIDADSEAVLLEVAYFDPRSVRRTSRRLGIHSEASHRFERGVDPNAVPRVMRRAVGLLSDLAEGAVHSLAVDANPKPITAVQIDLRDDQTEALLGMEIGRAERRRALEAIGCMISPGESSGWRVAAPTWRPDLTRPEDLIEEVARIVGYDRIPTTLPRLQPSGRGLAPRVALERRLREAGAAVGLYEARNLAFVSAEELAEARVSTDAVVLANPLSEERAVMRTSLLPGLLTAAGRAYRRQARTVMLFEVAPVYGPTADDLPTETLRVGVLLLGARPHWVGDDGDLDFYDGKGFLESLCEAALAMRPEAVLDDGLDEDAPFLHPAPPGAAPRGRGDGRGPRRAPPGGHRDLRRRRSGDLRRARRGGAGGGGGGDGRPADDGAAEVPGGEPRPGAPRGRGADGSRGRRGDPRGGGALVEAVELFDVYRGEHVPDGQKSLALRVVYRDPEATLTDKKVDKAHKRLVQRATSALGATVRA